MAESLYPPFFKWGSCKSKDKDKPDVVKIKVQNLETWESEFTINITAMVTVDGELVEMNVPMKYHESKNSSLIDAWTKAVNAGKIKEGQKLIIKTYLDKSKNDRNIRRFSLEKPS